MQRKQFAHQLWIWGQIITILFALVIGMIRYLLPQIADYRGQAATYLSLVLGAEINIGEVEARLVGFTPQLLLTDVKIYLPSPNAPISLHELRLGINLIDSLSYGTLRLAWLTISGAHLVIRTTPDGRLELNLWSDKDAPAIPLTFLLSQGPLLLLDGTIQLERSGVPTLYLKPVTAKLLSHRERLYLEFATSLEQNELQLQIELNTSKVQEGRLHLKTTNLALKQWLKPWLPKNWQLDSVMDAELWVNWSGNELEILGPITLHNLSFSTVGPAKSWAKRLSTQVKLKKSPQDNWNGWLTELIWEQAGHSIEGAEIALRWPVANADMDPRLRFAIADMQLHELATSASTLPLPTELRKALLGLSVQGQVQNLRLEIALPTNAPPQWELSAQVIDFSNQAWLKIPGVKGLDLDIYATSAGGSVNLGGQELIVDAPHVFRAPLPALNLEGILTWEKTANGDIKLDSQELILENQDFTTHTRLSVLLPKNGSTPFLDIQTHFSDGNLGAAYHYFPVGAMKKPLIDWLDHAMVAGHITQGNVVLRGLADDFPFHKHEGRFEAVLDVGQVIVNYDEQWPRLEDAMGQISFIDAGLAIDVQTGQILNSQVQKAHAEVADIKLAIHLPIIGEITGPFTDVLKILRGPMATTHGRYVKGMQVEGTNKVVARIDIPIEPGATIKIDGRIYWEEAALQLQDWGLNLNDINGNLRFTDYGLFAEDIKASLVGEALNLSVDTPRVNKGEQAATYLDVQLPISTTTLNTLVPGWPWELVTNSAVGNLRLTIEHQEHTNSSSAMDYRLESNLQGLAVLAPDPIGKTADSTLRLVITGVLPISTPHLLTVNYGKIQAAMRIGVIPSTTTPRIIAGEILSNSPRRDEPKHSGLHIGGRVQRLDIPSWLSWIKQHGDEFGRLSTLKTTGKVPIIPLLNAELHLSELVLPQELKNLDLTLIQSKYGWEANLKSPKLAGKLLVSNKPRQPIQARFTRVQIDLPSEEQADTVTYPSHEATTEADLADPLQFPPLDLQIDALQLGTQLLGKFIITSKPKPSGIQITKLALTGPLINLTGQGDWTGTKEVQTTQIHLEGKSADFGSALRGFGFKSGLQQANLHMDADLRWPAPPQNLSLEHITGTAKLRMSKGRVVDISPGIGRLFGLLNLETLLRRLTLDFSDLFGQGFAFDRINGEFNLKYGNVTTNKFTIEGPAAKIAISGHTGLITKDYDQIITVIPSISSTLPIAGVVAGGPVAAAALLVADQIMGEQVNRLVRLQYHLTGPWKSPDMPRIKTQDGWSFSNLLVPSTTPNKR